MRASLFDAIRAEAGPLLAATPAAEIPAVCSSRSNAIPLRFAVGSLSSCSAALPLAVVSSGNRMPTADTARSRWVDWT